MNGTTAVENRTASAGRGSKQLLCLCREIDDHVESGSYHASDSLGIQSMPDGYALMLNHDRTHYYWLRWDGTESAIHWSKWACYRGAKADAEKA